MRRLYIRFYLIVLLSTTLCGIKPLMASDLTNGLIGYWKFDENSGTSAFDSSGNGATATLAVGATWAAGKKLYAASLDGNDDTILTTAVTTSAAGSMSAWAYPTATSTNAYVFNTVGSGTNRFYLNWSGTGLKCSRGNPNTQVIMVSEASALGKWNHVTCTWDATTMYAYFNGKLIGSSAYTNSGGGGTLKIGYQSASATTFPGYIDEARLYNRTLSESEIRQIFLGSNPNLDGM